MVTLNINIEGDGIKSSGPAQSNTNALIQQDLPSPTALTSFESVGIDIPAPGSLDQSMEAGLSSESVPHPEDSGIALSTAFDHVPTPEMGAADQVGLGSGIPEPSETEKSGTASSAAKPKTRATKSRTTKK